MAGNPGKDLDTKPKEELLRCPVCDSYFEQKEGFFCPKCKRGPLCRKHRVRGKRECMSCVLARKSQELVELQNQKNNIQSFFRFVHFLFLVFAVFFAAYKLNLAQQVEFLNNEFIADNLIYLGIAICLGYIFFFIILFAQKSKIKELESQIREQRNL